MVRIRAFRAINDLESCKRFSEGHIGVLTDYKVPIVSSAKTEWFHNPGVYVLIVETVPELKAIGGTRIHVANGIHPLPIESAIGEIDPGIYDLVNQYQINETGELCGLWNSKEAAGKGYSTLLIEAGVAEAGIALARTLKLKSLFALGSPWTVGTTLKVGFTIEKSIGNGGTLPYPKPDLLATALIIRDTEQLESADPKIKNRIISLRNEPRQTKMEPGSNGMLEIDYDLVIPNFDESQNGAESR